MLYNITMFFRHPYTKNETRIGVVIDIGSASVAVALVLSKKGEQHPSILWSHRERLSETSTFRVVEKQLQTAILNVFLELSSVGLPSLSNSPKLKEVANKTPELVQVSISAPFAHTVSHTTKVESDEPFRINGELIRSVVGKAQRAAEEKAESNLVGKVLKLNLLSSTTVSTEVNDYIIKPTKSTFGDKLVINQFVTFGDDSVVNQVKDTADKVLRNTPLDIDSFMSLFFRTLNDLNPRTDNACLMSVTAEATELCIIGNGIPGSSFFIPTGQYSLARTISDASGLIMSESLSLLKDNDINNIANLSEQKKEVLTKVFTKYQSDLSELFKQGSNSGSIPATIYLHTDKLSEGFFSNQLIEAFTLAVGRKPIIHPITSEFFDFGKDEDTAILTSAYVFHRRLYEDDYEF